MSTRERLFLTPVEKCAKYGIVPWKMLANLALLGAVTAHVVLMNTQESNYVQSASRAWYRAFYPTDYDFSDPVWYTYTVNDTSLALTHALAAYYALNTDTPDVYGYTMPGGGLTNDSTLAAPPTLSVTSYSDVSSLFDPSRTFTGDTLTAAWTLNATWAGPLDAPTVPYEDMAAFLHTLVHMELTFPPIQHFAFGSLYRNCFLWSITVHFDFTNRGQIQYTMDQDVVQTCDVFTSTLSALSAKFMWMNVVIIALCVVHSALILRAMARSLRLTCRLTRWAAEQARQLTEEARAAGIDLAAHGIDDDDDYDETEEEVAPGVSSPSKTNAVGGGSDELGASLLRDDRGAQQSMAQAAGAAAMQQQARRKSSARMQIEIHTDMDVDGTGELFVTATDTSLPPEIRVTRSASTHAPTGEISVNGARARAPDAIVFAPGSTAAGGSATHGDVNGGVHVEHGVRPGVSAESKPDAATETEDANRARLIAAARAARALNTTWRSMPWRDKLRVINGWAVLSLVSDACNVASCAINLQRKTAHIPSDESHALLMGFGISLLWLGVLRYMEHNRTYFNIVLTLRRAGPRVLRFLMGVLPIFIAYSLFAVVMFSDRVPRFCDVRTAFITLFANLNGDVVRETMMAMVAYQPVVAQLFFYSFIALHIYVVLNIIIAVVEESYFITITKTQEMQERREEDEARAKEAEEAARKALSKPWQPGAPDPPAPDESDAQPDDSTITSGHAGASVTTSTHPAGALQLFSSLPPDVLASATAPKTDSNSLKERPDSQLSALLRLSEWDEVLTGERIRSKRRQASTASPASMSARTQSPRPPHSGL